MPLLLANRWAERSFNFKRRQENESPCPRTVPPWDLPTVLRALRGPPFWTIAILEPQKTALLLATGVGQASRRPAGPFRKRCLPGFGPYDSKVVLKPRLGYVPKVLSTPFRAQVIALSVLPLPQQAARNPWSPLSGPWKYTLSILPRTEIQNSFCWLR